MPEQWLNNDVADMVDVDLPFDAFAPVYTNRNLEVLAAKPEYLLALKLMVPGTRQRPHRLSATR